MQPARKTARAPVTFDELLGWLAQEGLVDATLAQDLFARQDAQRARLVHERRAALGLPPGNEPQINASITPIELFLSFGIKDEHGQGFAEDQLTELYARRIGLPYQKLDPLELDAEFITNVFSKPFARKHNLLAIADRGVALKVATCNPFDTWALESVERIAGKQLELVIASKTDIQRLITEFYGFRTSVKRAEVTLNQGIDLGNLEQFVRMKTEREIEASDEHVVHAVEYLFNYAFQQRASDIHLEPKRSESVVRYRIDGALHEVNRLPRVVHNAVINRIKTLARLDIGEKRRPQDGRIKTEFQGKPVDIRVSTLAVAFGEKAVLRIFDPDVVDDDLGKLGFLPREREMFERLIQQPHGIILVTGPTGSGKTTTLYTALRKRASDDVNITTIEDPIEMVFDRINQTAINPSIGLGFAESLRTLLRQDPDIIMVGEIRDLETARYAIQAALTGHLVFSTLHTSDAASAVTRLLDLGAENFLLASTLHALIAQRLVKRVCPHCAVERELSEAEIVALRVPVARDERGEVVSMHGVGCVECRQSGYLGRSAIYEMFELTDRLRRLVMDRADAGSIKRQARVDGMMTLREAAVQKMLDRVTSFEEVVAVTREDEP
jgi:general secretion pathway protein E